MPKADGSLTKSELVRTEDARFTAFLEKRGQEIEDRFLAGRNRSVIGIAARQQHFLKSLERVISGFEKKYYPGKNWAPRKHGPNELTLSVNLSDLHYGAALDGR